VTDPLQRSDHSLFPQRVIGAAAAGHGDRTPEGPQLLVSEGEGCLPRGHDGPREHGGDTESSNSRAVGCKAQLILAALGTRECELALHIECLGEHDVLVWVLHIQLDALQERGTQARRAATHTYTRIVSAHAAVHAQPGCEQDSCFRSERDKNHDSQHWQTARSERHHSSIVSVVPASQSSARVSASHERVPRSQAVDSQTTDPPASIMQ